MKNLRHLITGTLMVVLSMLSATSFAQTKYTLAASPVLKVTGGSTLHDWEMVSSSAQGEGMFVMEAGQLKGIPSLKVEMPAETLKSGTKGLDSNAYKALKTSQHKQVKFVLKELTGSGTNYQAKGDFTIAGVTKSASFPVKLTPAGDKLTFEGSYATKLTNFSVDPPTALMGTVKTKDDITIHFKTTFQPTK